MGGDSKLFPPVVRDGKRMDKYVLIFKAILKHRNMLR